VRPLHRIGEGARLAGKSLAHGPAHMRRHVLLWFAIPIVLLAIGVGLAADVAGDVPTSFAYWQARSCGSAGFDPQNCLDWWDQASVQASIGQANGQTVVTFLPFTEQTGVVTNLPAATLDPFVLQADRLHAGDQVSVAMWRRVATTLETSDGTDYETVEPPGARVLPFFVLAAVIILIGILATLMQLARLRPKPVQVDKPIRLEGAAMGRRPAARQAAAPASHAAAATPEGKSRSTLDPALASWVRAHEEEAPLHMGKPRFDAALTAHMLLAMLLLFVLYAGFFSLGLLLNIPLSVVIGLAIAALMLHLLNAEWIMRHALGPGLRDASSDPLGRGLQALLERVAMQAGTVAPRVMVMPNSMPNACALGISPRHGTIVVTTGLLALQLSAEEMEAVLAHELSHLLHRDTLVMIAASTFTALAALIGRTVGRLAMRIRWTGGSGHWQSSHSEGGGGGGGRGGGGGAAVLGIIAIIVAVVVIVVVALMLNYLLTRLLSRFRELAADRGAAVITGRPAALGGALIQIQRSLSGASQVDLRALRPASALMLAPQHPDARLDASQPKKEAGWALQVAAWAAGSGVLGLLISWWMYSDNDALIFVVGPLTALTFLAAILALPVAATFYLWHRYVPDRDLLDVLSEFVSTHPSFTHRLEQLEAIEAKADLRPASS
jgi:heat shock protein HtpX